MLVVLRDGRKLHGVLRSYDQFGEPPLLRPSYTQRLLVANLVLEDTVERIYHGNAFAEHWHGLFLIRGENVVLLGEIARLPAICPSARRLTSPPSQDLDQEDDVPLRQVDYSILEQYHKEDMADKKAHEDIKSRILYEQKGFCKEGGEGDGY